MLQKLRWKFVAMFMAVAALTLAVSFSVICYLTYAKEVEAVYTTLERSMDLNWSLYHYDPLDNTYVDEGADAGSQPHIGGTQNKDPFIPIASYIITDTGTVITRTYFSTAIIADNDLVNAITAAMNSTQYKGYLPELGLYFRYKSFEGQSLISFADKSSASDWEQLAMYLAGLAALLLALLFAISVALSKWMVKPTEEAWRSQQQFIADASHELKTPLTVIMANNEILMGKKDATIGQEFQWIESTQNVAKSMQSLVNDLLELARIDSEAERAPKSQVDLSSLAEKNALQFESVAFDSDLEIATIIEPDCQVMGYDANLQRLLATLLDNACKYSKPGTTVQVKVSRNQSHVFLEVTSHGDPIDPEDLPHVFDRFYRSDKARTQGSGNGSFGLGLAIAKRIAEDHDGTIQVDSSQSAGTTFTVILPVV